MRTLSISLCLIILCHFSLFTSSVAKNEQYSTQGFLQCLNHQTRNHTAILNVTYTPRNSLYSTILDSTIRNLRFATPSTRKPLAIITPLYEYQVQPIIYCSRKHGLQIRVRSGGHDHEGLSYTSEVPFVIIDVINLNSVDVDVASNTAWVQSGASVEELYNKIAEKSQTLGFPAGICLTIGTGGHFSGGGYGAMLRKHGLAADHILDARLVDANGRILDRDSMGEDVFWAIRGGSGGSFGVVLSWKVKLVPVPQKVTVFTVLRSLEQNATQIIHRWQYVAPKFHEDMFLMVSVHKANSNGSSESTIEAAFASLFLGGVDRLIHLMQENFPELNLRKEDCIEMSWVESTNYFQASIAPSPKKRSFKGKSDYVKKPIPIKGIEGVWKQFFEEETADPSVILIPYGGVMENFSENELPFPHRAGNLFMINYGVFWDEEGKAASQKHINWIRKLYKYMTPYVSKNPREAYVNYRDLDLGVNNDVGSTSYAQASIWGTNYFKSNFHRLAKAKTMFDPSNFFRHEQSIPLI